MDAFELLVGKNHAATNVTDNGGMLPLHAAVGAKADSDAARALLGASPFAAASVADNDGVLPAHVAERCGCDCDLVHLLVEANPFAVIKTTDEGKTPLQMASRAETRDLLVRRQDEALRLIRDTIVSETEDVGLPEVVVSMICSFALPKIMLPIEDELKW